MCVCARARDGETAEGDWLHIKGPTQLGNLLRIKEARLPCPRRESCRCRKGEEENKPRVVGLEFEVSACVVFRLREVQG